MQCTSKNREASTLSCTENLHTKISTRGSTLTPHWSTCWGSSEPWTIRLRPCPLRKRGRTRNRSTSGEHLKSCGCPPRASVKTSKRSRADGEEMRKRNNIIVLYLTGSSEELFSMPVRFKLTNTLRQKRVHPKDSACLKILVFALPAARWLCHIDVVYGSCSRSVKNLLLEYFVSSLGNRIVSCSTSSVHLQSQQPVALHLCSQHPRPDLASTLVSDGLSNWVSPHLAPAYFTVKYQLIFLHSAPESLPAFGSCSAPHSNTATIHTWALLARATHRKDGWVQDPQVALTTLKLRVHTCP